MKRLAYGFALVAVLQTAASSVAQVPSLTGTVPGAVEPGKTTRVRFTGDNLTGAAGIWTNLAGVEAAPIPPAATKKGEKAAAPNPKLAEFDLKVPADATPGVYGVRVVTSHGASNLRLVMVDDLPTVAEAGNNKTRETAQVISPPIAIEGAADAESFDYFRFHAEAGQRMSVEAVARRIGSPLDPVVRLLDASGRELSFADDDESTGPDGRFTFRFQKSGDYWLEVRDVRYAGNANYRYRLRIGDFPLLSAPYPMGVQQGTKSLVQAAGADVGPIPPLSVTAGSTRGGQLPLSAKYAAGQGSGLAMLAVSASPEQTEIEPNDEPQAAATFALQGAVNGRFERPQDSDYYRFEAKKGARYRFVGRTRGFGTPADLLLRITSTDGKTLAEAEDAGLDEGAIDYTFPADGAYLLRAEDLLGRGGPQFTYRVEIEPYAPGISLAVDSEKLDVPHGGVAKVKVTAVRRDFKGPITLKVAIDGGPVDISASGTIPDGKPDGILTITAGPALPTGKFFNVQIIGEGQVDKQTVSATAVTTPAFKTAFGGLTNPPQELVQQVAVSVGPPPTAFFQLDAPTKVVAIAQLVGKGTLNVKLKRLDKFDDVVALNVVGLPAGFTASAAKFDKGKTDAAIEISGPPTAAPIEHRFSIEGSGTYKDQPRKETLADLVLRVTPPIEATVDVGAPLTPGEKRKVSVRIVRHTPEKTPITLSWSSLPQGIATPAKFEIAGDKSVAETELAVDAKSPLGPNAAVLTAATTVGGRAVTFDVAVVPLNVVAPAAKAAAKAPVKKTAAK